MRSRTSVQQLCAAFAARFGGEVSDVRSHGTGHIHDTFVLCWSTRDASRELLVQRFNSAVFRDPAAVMQNIVRVTDHLRQQLDAEGASEIARRVLRVRPTPDGATHFQAADGGTYRAFEFIRDTISYDHVQRPEQPFEAGRAFGDFVARLADLPAPPLAETIPGFHDTTARLEALRAAFESDPCGRGSQLQAERERVEARAALAGYCATLHASGDLPLRVTHNDAKLANLLFDASTGRALCVVDLDTVMPGFAAYDFGDLVRTTACPIAEDAPDASQVVLCMDYVDGLARGYLSGTRAISEAELESLAMGPMLVCYELGVRFLTDHVMGDVYFPISHPGHNLERARVQLALMEEIAGQREEIGTILRRAALHARGARGE